MRLLLTRKTLFVESKWLTVTFSLYLLNSLKNQTEVTAGERKSLPKIRLIRVVLVRSHSEFINSCSRFALAHAHRKSFLNEA